MGNTALEREPSHVDENGKQSFRDWLGSPVIGVTIRRQHDQYYAVAHRFDLSGVGSTDDEALRDLAGLLEAYLHSCFNEGRTYNDSLRQSPPSRNLIGAVIGIAAEILGRVVERRRQLVLPSALRPTL